MTQKIYFLASPQGNAVPGWIFFFFSQVPAVLMKERDSWATEEERTAQGDQAPAIPLPRGGGRRAPSGEANIHFFH